MKLTCSLGMSLIFSALTLSCLADAPYSVDSPSTTAARHHFILFNYASSSGGGKESESVPGFTYKYGIFRDWEFKFDTSVATYIKPKKERETGVGDANMQLKWRFINETKKSPALAFGYKIKLPLANKARGLGTGETDNTIYLTIGKSFGRYRIYSNFGYTFLGTDGVKKVFPNKNYNYYGAVLTYQATEHLVVGAQFYGNSPKATGGKDELAWGVGATYKYAPDHTLYLAAGKSEHGFSNLNVYAGLGLTFK